MAFSFQISWRTYIVVIVSGCILQSVDAQCASGQVLGMIGNVTTCISRAGLSCVLAANNSRAEWTTLNSRRGLLLSSAPRLFTQECDRVVFQKTAMAAVFEHVNVLRSTDTNTSIFLQVSVRNPAFTSLRFAIGSVVLVVNTTHTRTSAPVWATGAFSAGTNNYDLPDTFKAQQMQELHIMITKKGEECTLRVGFGPAPPSASPVIQTWRCFADNLFFVHGSEITLHSVILQVNRQREAMWDFSRQTSLSIGTSLCAECAIGNTLDRETKQCTPCYTGIRVNVDENSEWWSTSASIPRSGFVPKPDWAVLNVGEMRQTSGILRHSSTNSNGNMILTQGNSVYAYEDYDSVPRVCTDAFESRVRQNLIVQNTCEQHILLAMGVTSILINWKAGRDNSVRSYLSLIETWSPGDTVKFCEFLAHRNVLDHLCENPVLFTNIGQNIWQPININPIHYNHTRYTLKLMKSMLIPNRKY